MYCVNKQMNGIYPYFNKAELHAIKTCIYGTHSCIHHITILYVITKIHSCMPMTCNQCCCES